MIGAVFAVVLYFALRSGLVQLTTTDATGATQKVFFYATLAFIAGFSERKARVMLGGATKMLGGDNGDDDHAPGQDLRPDPARKLAEGSAA